nr:Ig-like domain-containing protein [Paenibacillus periandrae]
MLIISVLPGLAFAAPILVSSVTITNPAATVAMGGTLQMGVTVLPANATNPTLTWSIMPATGNASISSSGLLTPITPGLVVVKADANDGSNQGTSVIVTITPILVTGITVTSAGNAVSLNTGATLQLTATVAPVGATNSAVTWTSSSTAVATVSSSGLLTAKTAGTVTVTAKSTDGSNKTGTKVITITAAPIAVTGITVTSTADSVVSGGTLQFSTNVLPATATNKQVTWTVSGGTGSGSIDANGLLTAALVGTVEVIATAQDGSYVEGTKTITVTAPPILVNSIVVAGSTSVVEGNTITLTSSVLPSTATNKAVTWSLTGTAATINSVTGVLTAVSSGAVDVKATAADGSGIVSNTHTVTVLAVPKPVTGITISSNSVTNSVYVGDTIQLTVDVLPVDATNKNVVWSAFGQTGSATITQAGVLTGVNAGTVTVKAVAADGSGVNRLFTITVETPPVATVPVTGISITSANTVSMGNTLQINSTVTPNNATNKTLTYSVVPATTGSATISSTGVLAPTGVGVVEVTVSSADGSSVVSKQIITITSSDIFITNVSLDTGSAPKNVVAGNTLQVNATILPANATNKTIAWSVTPITGSATISSSGLLTAVSAGTVTVTGKATDGSNAEASIIDIVITPPVTVLPTSITVITPNTDQVIVGQTLQLSTTVTPSNAVNNSVSWSVYNNTGTANIDAITGLLTGVKEGAVTVTAATYSGSAIKGTKTITVIAAAVVPIAVTGITVNSDVSSVYVNNTIAFTATVAPDNAANKEVVWSVVHGTGTATISETGVLTALTGGSVKVVATAKDGSGITGSKDITITFYKSSGGSSGGGGGPVVTTPTPEVPVNNDPNATTPSTTNGLISEKSNVNAIIQAIKEVIASSKAPQNFTDITNHWSVKTVRILNQLGIVDGFPDGQFKPDASTTRAEFASLIVRAFKIGDTAGSSVQLKDVANHWSAADVQKLVNGGIINGYEDGTFRPDASITRAEVIAIVSRLVDLAKATKVSTSTFKDVDGAWNKDQIQQAAEAGIISGKQEGQFYPNSTATRSEALAIMLRTLELNPEIKALLAQLQDK